MRLLSSNHISQYFQEATYKILPKAEHIKVVIIILGKNKINKIELMACFNEETSEIFKKDMIQAFQIIKPIILYNESVKFNNHRRKRNKRCRT